MKNSYTHLTREERYHISAQRKIGTSISRIARELNRNKSTISRELKRNIGLRGYCPKQAQGFANSRTQKATIKSMISAGRMYLV